MRPPICTPEAFFLPTARGARFCLYYQPAGKSRGDILYVHPFAEEMNKTRRIAAQQARRLCALGWGVLQIDLAGCGDSEGDFGDATWDIWLADLAAAWSWLAARASERATACAATYLGDVRGAADPEERWVWGLRLGALLAETFAVECARSGVEPSADGLLLWQPVASGAQHLTQFLRLRAVQGLFDPASKEAPGETAQTLRAELNAGRSLEVAGYRLAPELALPMAGAELGALNALPPKVLWFDVSSSENAALSPASARVAEKWSALGVDVRSVVVPGPAFWQTQEIEACPALLDATEAALAQSNATETGLAGRDAPEQQAQQQPEQQPEQQPDSRLERRVDQRAAACPPRMQRANFPR